MKYKNIGFLLIALSTLLLYTGCRKASTRTGGSSHSNEFVQEDSRAERVHKPERKISSEPVKSKEPLSGAAIFKKYGSTVFMIFTSDGTNNYQGSGFFIGKDGLAVSNYHVFEGTNIGSENIKLSYDDQNLYKVTRVIYKSKEPDFIVFQVDYDNKNYIPLAKSKPNIGEKVYAIGSPRGLENTFSSGEISQWRGEFLMQISALIDHGSSGGALINEFGEAIGITSGSFYDGSQANLNYAWSIEAVKNHLK